MKTERLYPGVEWTGPTTATNVLRVVVGESVSKFQIDKLRAFIEARIPNPVEFAQTTNGELPQGYEIPWSRTICIGAVPAAAVLGRKVYPMSSRRAYAWVDQGPDIGWGDVYWTPDQKWALQNRFVGSVLTDDLTYALTAKTPEPPFDATYQTIETVEDALEAEDALREAAWAAYDCETGGLMFSDYFEVCMVAAVTDTYLSFVWGREALRDRDMRLALTRWLEDAEAPKVGHNLKFDMLAPKAAWGCQVRGCRSDTMLKRRLIQADAMAGLEQCSELVGMGGYKQAFGELLQQAKSSIRKERMRARANQAVFEFAEHPALDAAIKRRDLNAETFAFALVPEQDLRVYCVRDAYCTALLEHRLADELQHHPGPLHIWNSIVKDATAAIERMETWGISIDRAALADFRQYVEDKRQGIAKDLLAQGLDDPNSHRKTATFLFDTLGLIPYKHSEKTGEPSTDVTVLRALATETKHPAVKLLLEYRRLAKLAQAYGDKLHLYIREGDRIHPTLKLDGTRTGRLSCENPGLHQIPRAESEEGKRIKNCFVAPPGHQLIQLDFSQLELRVAAMLSGDRVMRDMFLSGEDFHTATAKLIAPTMWRIRPDQVEKKHRTAAKTFNFGLLYGMTTKGMAERMQCSQEEAERLKSAILGQWTDLAKWVEAQEKLVEDEGCTYTWWAGKTARRRPLYAIAANSRKERNKARNGAVNTPVQGTASDFCLASLLALVNLSVSGRLPAKVVMSVHDSIILEARDEDVARVAREAHAVMTSWDSAGVPVQVDCEVGRRWGSLEPLTLE